MIDASQRRVASVQYLSCFALVRAKSVQFHYNKGIQKNHGHRRNGIEVTGCKEAI